MSIRPIMTCYVWASTKHWHYRTATMWAAAGPFESAVAARQHARRHFPHHVLTFITRTPNHGTPNQGTVHPLPQSGP